MPTCKNCSAEQVVKNGIVAGKQRYQCKKYDVGLKPVNWQHAR